MTAQRSDAEQSTAIPTYEQSLIDEHGAEAVANYRADTFYTQRADPAEVLAVLQRLTAGR